MFGQLDFISVKVRTITNTLPTMVLYHSRTVVDLRLTSVAEKWIKETQWIRNRQGVNENNPWQCTQFASKMKMSLDAWKAGPVSFFLLFTYPEEVGHVLTQDFTRGNNQLLDDKEFMALHFLWDFHMKIPAIMQQASLPLADPPGSLAPSWTLQINFR
jgi:hypothetical protein